MCKKTVDVVSLEDERHAYEVEQYLTGLPFVDDVTVDFISNELVIEYDETLVSYDQVLDKVEHAGCKPTERSTGIVDWIRNASII